MDYRIVVEFEDHEMTFPAGLKGAPGDWDFYGWDAWKTRIVKESAPVLLFDAWEDSDMITRPARSAWYQVVPSADPALSMVEIKARNLKNQEHDYSFRYCFKKNTTGRNDDLSEKKSLLISGLSLDDKPLKIQVALVMSDGSSYGGLIELTNTRKDHTLDLDALKEVKLALLPTAYPTMMPYWFEHPNPRPFDISEIESIQISMGPGIPETEYGNPHGFALERIWLE